MLCSVRRVKFNSGYRELVARFFSNRAFDFEFRIVTRQSHRMDDSCGFEHFYVHKELLKMLNPYFNELFTRGSWWRRNVIYLDNVTTTIFEQIIEVIYTGECLISNENVCDLFRAAMLYHLDEVVDECLTFMCQTLNAINCIDYLELAIEFSFDNLRRECLQCIQCMPMKIMGMDKSTSCTPEAYGDMLEVIPRYLHTNGFVFDHAIRWAQNRLGQFQHRNLQNDRQTRQILSPFLNYTRFTHLTYADFLDRYERHRHFFTPFEYLTICTYLRERRERQENRQFRRGRVHELINDRRNGTGPARRNDDDSDRRTTDDSENDFDW